MKRFFLLTLLWAVACFALAAPLKNMEVRLTQPDGQVIHCFASGDEYYNYLHDANGFTIVQGEGGYYVYAMKDADGKVVPSSYRVNSVDPATVGLQPYAKISAKEYYARRHEWEKHIQTPQMKNGREMNHGLYNNLVVFIRFAGDTYHHSSFSTVQEMFNGDSYDSNSLHNYYHHTSYNQLDLWSHFFPQPEGETILSYEDIHPKQYYQPYDPVTNPMGYQEWETADREFSMLERAIAYIEDMVPDSIDLDYNNDGNVDNVVFVIKGEPGAWASLLWPHRWSIYDRYVPLHNLRVFDFNLQLEQGGYFNVSTLCHEMCHSLSAPDLYHYSDGIDPVGSWDLMCGTTEPPQQTNTYMKLKYGNWVDDIPTITEPGVYELEAVSWEGGRRNGYKIPINSNQFFFLEYRDKNNIFERQIPGSGLLIYRIDTRYDGNAGWNGYDSFDEVYLFRPGGNINQAGDLNYANFSANNGRTVFNSDSNPRPFLTNGQYLDWAYQICNVSETGDRISFELRMYQGEGATPGPEHFIAHVNSLDHQVELSWDAKAGADYYNVYCDHVEIASHLTSTEFVYPYTEADNGYHTFSVLSSSGGMANYYSAESEDWVILGHYETLRVNISSDSPFGTKGGELTITFSNPEMKTQYMTLYSGKTKETDIQVPANTTVYFDWTPGFDPESQGIHVSAMHLNDHEQCPLFDITDPEEGSLATYTTTDEGLGCHNPQHLTATPEGSSIRLRWTMATETNRFNIYRDGILIAPNISDYEFLDDQFTRSGTHRYQVEACCGDYFSWNPDLAVYAAAMCYYCEPPQHLQGIHHETYDELSWEAPQFAGNGLFAFDDNHYVDNIALGGKKWAIKLDPEHLAAFNGLPIAYLETYDCTEGTYRFRIYNGEATNNNTLLLTQEYEVVGSNAMVRIPLEAPVYYTDTLPLWITVQSLHDAVVPYCHYVGVENSALVSAGNNWAPASTIGLDCSWMLRAYTDVAQEVRDFTYNVYWGPEEGGDEQLEMIVNAIQQNSITQNNTENRRYNVTALWNGRETDLSNTIYLGPSVSVEETAPEATSLQVFPNPVRQLLTIQGQGLQRITLHTLTGVLVEDRPAEGDHLTLSMESLPKGMYLVGIRSDEGYRVVKVVKE